MPTPLDELKAEAAPAPSKPTATSKTKRVMMDYAGKSGADQIYEHKGPRVMILGGCEPLAIYPGLNVLDSDQCKAYSEHPPFAALMASGELSEVKPEQLTGPRLEDLARRTFSADALEFLLDLEISKPQVAGRARRRSAEVVEMLNRKLARAAKRNAIDLSGIGSAARDQASVLATGGEHARFDRLEREGRFA